MKRMMLLLSAFVMFCTTACAAAQEPGKISVVSTIFAPYDFARQVAGGLADVTMLLPPGSESHSYEPTPQDVLRVQNADVFICVGGESDVWVRRLLDSMDVGGMRVVRLMESVQPVFEELVEGMQDDEHEHADEHDDEHEHADEHDDEHEHADEGEAGSPEYDEHVWTSPVNAQAIVRDIAEALKDADPANAAQYEANAAAYIGELERLDATLREVVEAGVRRTVVFGDRFPFRYLADEYGLTYFAAFPGCSTETEPSAATVKFLIDKIREERIPVVFTIELSTGRMADTICEETGAARLTLNACHNISKSDFEAGATYLGLMEHNVAALREALG